jgi:hypothetical protein
MSTNNIVFESAAAQTLTFATKEGAAITYVYGSGDWDAYRGGTDPAQLSGRRVATPSGAVELALQFAARLAGSE